MKLKKAIVQMGLTGVLAAATVVAMPAAHAFGLNSLKSAAGMGESAESGAVDVDTLLSQQKDLLGRFNSSMNNMLLAQAKTLEAGGLKEDAQRYQLWAEDLLQAIRRHCWDEKAGMYYSVDLNLLPYTGKPEIIFGKPFVLHEGAPRDYPCLIQRLGSWSGFMALWAGVATEEQAERMVRENLLDENAFWAPHGIRTLAKWEKMYNLKATHNPSNWQGPIWGISNYMVFSGLVKYGYDKQARQLAEKTIALYGKDLQENGVLHEYYHPESGEGIINPGFQNWNYLVINMIAWIENRPLVREF